MFSFFQKKNKTKTENDDAVIDTIVSRMDQSMSKKVFYGGSEEARNILKPVRSILYSGTSSSTEQYSNTAFFYTQTWIRTHGGLSPEFSRIAYIRDAMKKRFSQYSADVVDHALDECLNYIFENEPTIKEKVLGGTLADSAFKIDANTTKESIPSPYDDVPRIVPKYDTSDIGKARYLIEHQMLRDMFFGHPESTIQILLTPNGLYDFISIFVQKAPFENPYRPEDIRIDTLRWNGDISLVSIELPEPEFVPLCYRIHLFYSDTYSNLGYYTIERSVDNHAFLCGWDKDRNHLNYRQMKSAVWPEKEKGFWKVIEASLLIELHAKNNNLKSEKEKTDNNTQ